MSDDAYDTLPPIPIGENLLKIDGETGELSVTRKEPGERPNAWKGAKQIAACSDEAISVVRVRPSGVIDYRVLDVSVSYRGQGHGAQRQYLCHSHVTNHCPHTERLHRWRQEHPELNAA